MLHTARGTRRKGARTNAAIISFQNINIRQRYVRVRTYGTWNIAHVERQRLLKRGDLLAVHRELGRDEPIPRFLTHLLQESIHLGTAARRRHLPQAYSGRSAGLGCAISPGSNVQTGGNWLILELHF